MSNALNPSETIATAARVHDFAARAVIGTDATGTIVYWNEIAAALYGWSTADAVGRNVLDITPTETSSNEALHIMTHMRAGRDWAGEFMVRRRDGTPVVMHVTTIPVLDDETLIGVIGVSYLDARRTPGSMRAMKE